MITKLLADLRTGYALGLRNIRVQAKQHALGYSWAIIVPTLYAVCFIFIKRELAGGAASNTGEEAWAILRAFTGIALFQFWLQLVQEMADFIRRQRGMLRGLSVGPTPFVIAIIFEGILALAIRVALIMLAIPILGLPFPDELAPWALFTSALITLLLSGASIGMALAPWAALYSDIRKALVSLGMPLILISPIFYEAVERTDSALYWVNLVNPLASPLATIADALQGNSWSFYAMPMFYWSLFSFAVLLLCLKQLRYQIPIVLERVAN
jgi:ABC-type polysaccharide/polyol phosphate export permease